MDVGRKIAQATGAWLQYEFACNRSELFSEKYMAKPIGDVLHTIYKNDVCAEYKHPVLAAAMMGAGRRPEVDFAVTPEFDRPTVFVETKWVSKNAVSKTNIVSDIFWDAIRLSLAVADSMLRKSSSSKSCSEMEVIGGGAKIV